MPDTPHRFFIALLPPQDVQDYASSVIQELGDRYQTRAAKAPPHITLQAPFLWSLDAVADLEHCLATFAQSQSVIPVSLSGFAAFKPRVLYLNVLKTPELLALQSQLMNELEAQLNIVDPVAKNRPFSPHITVASRNVTRQSFKQAWADLQPRQVQFEFMGDRLTVLIHDGQQWQIRSNFPLLGIPNPNPTK